jgi:predicted membrane-bound dolichyl-phosphate-mannose-protein mannosyltransferase
MAITEELTVNQLDETANTKVQEFFEKDYNTEEIVEFFKESQKREYVTDADFEEVFYKVAEEYKPKDWTELEGKIHTLFSGKMDDRLERFGTKLALDRTSLKALFNVK